MDNKSYTEYYKKIEKLFMTGPVWKFGANARIAFMIMKYLKDIAEQLSCCKERCIKNDK